jgi:hypothetical protein
MAATFNEFSEKYLGDIIGKINPTTVSSKVAVNARLGGMLQADIYAIRTAVSDVIRDGAMTGMTNPELAAAMIEKTQKLQPMATFVDKAGRNWKADSYFAMLNRSLHANVARDTYADTMAEAELDLVMVNGSSSDPDSPCIPYEGQILSLTGATKGYTTMAEAEAAGLHHPNCVHTESVYIPENK